VADGRDERPLRGGGEACDLGGVGPAGDGGSQPGDGLLERPGLAGVARRADPAEITRLAAAAQGALVAAVGHTG
jgi:hypothetical protein